MACVCVCTYTVATSVTFNDKAKLTYYHWHVPSTQRRYTVATSVINTFNDKAKLGRGSLYVLKKIIMLEH